MHQAGATTTPEIRAAPLTLCYSTPSEDITQSHEPVRTSSQKPVPSLACRLELVFPLMAQGSRTVTDQALIQLSALPLTLLLAALGGCLTGEFCLQCNGMEGARGRGIDGFGGKGQEQPQSKASPSGRQGRAQRCSGLCKPSGGRGYPRGQGFPWGRVSPGGPGLSAGPYSPRAGASPGFGAPPWVLLPSGPELPPGPCSPPCPGLPSGLRLPPGPCSSRGRGSPPGSGLPPVPAPRRCR